MIRAAIGPNRIIMGWSIRNQILIPILSIQATAVAAIALATAGLAARLSERQIVDRINGVAGTLSDAGFPLTASVLAKMRDLSGAQFLVISGGHVVETTIPGLTAPPALPRLANANRLEALAGAPTVEVAGTRYVALGVPMADRRDGSSVLVLYPEAGWLRARWEVAMPPLLVGLGSLALTAALTCWTAYRISRRLGAVRQQVARIASGHFRELDDDGHRDEVRDLSVSINQMCAQLREMRRTIQQSERTRLLAQLAAGLAHQLRNSLTGARMSIQLHAKRTPPREGDRSLEVALRQLAMTEEHVRGLLSLGRGERSKPTACDVNRLLDEVSLLLGPACQHAGVALSEHRANGPLTLQADVEGLRSAILNLALNAIEAAGPGGEVGLSASNGQGAVSIEVRDNGSGPQPELADSLFDVFVTSKPEGVGLGLALAHQVALDHGGRLAWTREDGQTLFRLTLPIGGGATEDS